MLADGIAAALGTPVRACTPVAGGDSNEAYRVELDDGTLAFAKTRDAAPSDAFAAEADGLARLAAASAARIPSVLAVHESFLALEWIDAGRERDAEQFGRQLAALHRFGAPSFGLDRDNHVGTVEQSNDPCGSWPAFYLTRRLEPLVRRNVDHGLLPADTTARLARFATTITERCGPPEPPALLHGDLWAGNRFTDTDGQPVLIDPAVYGGHREVDLAMMRLFGGFDDRTFAAYDEAFPLADGHQARVPLYQLYPLLVHVTMFGGSYTRSFVQALTSLGA